MRVLKFGGSSVANPDRVRSVCDIILNGVREEPIIVVVSAFQGVSSKLIKCAEMAAQADINYHTLQDEIIQQHQESITQLIPSKNSAVQESSNQLLDELGDILQGIFKLKELTLSARDLVGSFGERLSASIIAAYINQRYPAQYVDARQFIVTDAEHTNAKVIYERTNPAITQHYEENFLNKPIIPVITGFIGSTINGRTTTMGRNSSDFSAAIIGGALNASRIEIWTDVDGVYSADPNQVPDAFVLPQLSYLEAIELSHFGGKVIHAQTFVPVMTKKIPLLIKNTMQPDKLGTYIISNTNGVSPKQWHAKSVTAIDNITLLIWKHAEFADITHVKERLFRALSVAGIQPLIHLEASPNNHVYIAIHDNDLAIAHRRIEEEFQLEFKHKLASIEEKPSQSVVAIVGDDMKKLPPETAGKMFQYLGRMGIQINAIVYGASERNICLVIDRSLCSRALNLIHQAFFSEYKNLSIFMIGAGRVGNALLHQLQLQEDELVDKKINLNICAISNSKKMISNLDGINLSTYKKELSSSTEPFTIASFLQLIPKVGSSNIALIDCTASQEIVDAYPLFIQEGVHIITPNKRANVLPYEQYKSLMDQLKSHHTQFMCRANVGAGLPVLYILKDLLNCGDKIIKIEGIFSGTLSYLFNHYDGTQPFGQVLKKAHDLQLTEPDPREDLSGMDVGRKLLILARYMGWKVDLDDVSVESLVPKELQSGKFKDKFFDDYEKYEGPMKERLMKCKKDGNVLRYVGYLDVENRTISAHLEEIPLSSPIAITSYSDNIIAFITHHYHENPLVIRGPGAGVECTGLAVFSDILELISHLPD